MSIELFLRRVPFFANFTDDQLSQIAAIGEIVAFAQEHQIFKEGDKADRFYIIVGGQVRVYGRSTGGEEVEFNIFQAGDHFGELALLDGEPRSASAMCLELTACFTLECDAFRTLINSSPVLLERMFAGLAQMVRRSNNTYFQSELASRTMHTEMELDRHRALSQMVAGVAHEINTPLGSVATAASIIKSRLESAELKTLPQSPDAKSAYADVIEALVLLDRNVNRASQLVQSFKRISVSHNIDIKENLDIIAVIEDNLTLFRINARKSHLTLVLRNQLGSHSPRWVGYQGYLSQVLINLFSNIERYAYPDNVGGKVEITVQADDDRTIPVYLLTVQDFGRGISPEHLPHIFEAFFTTGRGSGGTGLGMAIVYNIVTTALRGNITIQSELNKGTTVILTLPQVIPEQETP